MKFYSVEYWQENWEELIDKIENGESIGITNGKHKAVMVPADDELIRIYTEQNNEAP
jgi:antitoxin (DNA-binding transcriptional repressor) of toxin-antitoxin stability system